MNFCFCFDLILLLKFLAKRSEFVDEDRGKWSGIQGDDGWEIRSVETPAENGEEIEEDGETHFT